MILEISHAHGSGIARDVAKTYYVEDTLHVVFEDTDTDEFTFENGTITMAYSDAEEFERECPEWDRQKVTVAV